MESIILNRDSWHYRFATVYRLDRWIDYQDSMSICEYSWKVLRGFLNVVIATASLGFIIGSVVDFGLYLVIIGFHLHDEPDWFGILGSAFLLFGGLYMLFTYCTEKLIIPKIIKREWNKNSFIQVAYRSIKDKVCFIVEFK